MVSVTLSRGSTSIDIPLVEESGQALVSADFGKPEIQVRESGGTINPRIQDQWSGLQNFNIIGKLFDYQKSHDLADLIKTASTDPLTLEIPLDHYPDSVTVAPAAGQEQALSLAYPAGKKNIVDVEMALTRVTNVSGVGIQEATTPTATGDGTVRLIIGNETVALPSADLSIERTVGRPNDVTRRQTNTQDPRYEVKNKVAFDQFNLSFQTIEDIPETLNAITDNMFRQNLGRRGLTLDFNGLLGLGQFDVIPTGSAPFRQVSQAGKGWVINPTMELRRIFV